MVAYVEHIIVCSVDDLLWGGSDKFSPLLLQDSQVLYHWIRMQKNFYLHWYRSMSKMMIKP